MQLEVIQRQPAQTPRPTPLLFVHGAWHGAWCWEEHYLRYFADAGYEVYALSLRGHGKSAGSYRGARIADYVADVAQVVDSLQTPPVLIGHSLGGFIVQKYLENHTVPAAILLASIPPNGALRFLLRTVFRQPVDTVKSVLRFDLHPLVDTTSKARKLFFSARLSGAQLAAYSTRLQGETFRGLFDVLLLDLPHPARIRMPILVIGAAEDQVFAVHEVKATARAYHTEAHILPGVAHDIMLDPDWKMAADLMLEWLRARDL